MFFFMIAHSNSQKLHVRNPIKTGSTDKFDISQSKKIVKDKDKRCNLEANKFKVIKVKEDDQINFYAVTGDTFVKLPSDDYENQIGSAECKVGWIESVFVEPKARNCGLASILTQLCMIDPGLTKNRKEDKHLVYEHLKRGLSRNDGDVQGVEKHLRSHCHGLIGLLMEATPLEGAYAYFSAAERLKYQYMVVHFYDQKIYQCGGRFKFYEVERAKNLYNSNTGRIEDDETDPEGSGYEAKWYFCRALVRKSKFFHEMKK